MKSHQKSFRSLISTLLVLLLVIGAGVCLYFAGVFQPQAKLEAPVSRAESKAESSASQAVSSGTGSSDTASEGGLPYDKLLITPERQKYQNEDMVLKIPKLKIDAAVWSGTTLEDMKHGVCLYDYAQLPGEENGNVSLVAHRNGVKNGVPNDHAPFYYIDTISAGDYLYLVYKDNIYRYRYKETFVVEEDDWEPIHTQGYSCLTLTTCTPVGVATHRLIVRSELDQVFPLTEDFVYEADDGSSKPASTAGISVSSRQQSDGAEGEGVCACP